MTLVQRRVVLRPNVFPFTLLLVGLPLAAVAIYATRAQVVGPGYLLFDDAFIAMRYGRNLADGFGLTWNPGEAPVEGYTCFLWVVLLALAHQIGLSQIVFAHWGGIVCVMATLLVTWRLAERLNPAGRVQNALAAGLVGLTPPFIQWSAGGMETPLFTLLATAAAAAYAGFRQGTLPAWWVGAIFCLVALTRPEGALLFGATLIYDVAGRALQRKPVIDRDLLALVGAFLLPYVVYFAWRWRYFGYLFPNTFYAKMGGGAAQWQGGLRYLAKSFELLLGGTAGMLLLPLLLARWRAAKGAGYDYLATLIVISWLITATEGGDHFGAARFLMPTLPLLFILLASGLSRLLINDAVTAGARSVILLIFLTGALNHWQPWSWAQRPIQIPAADPSTQKPLTLSLTSFVMMGQGLREIAQPGDTIAAVPVGAIGYFSGMNVIDMVGIVDPVIAHQPFDPAYTASWRPGHDKGDGTYILCRRPTYIQLRDQLTSQPVAGPDAHALQYRSIVEIWVADEFRHSYRFYPIRVTGGWYYNLYRRIDELPEVSQQ